MKGVYLCIIVFLVQVFQPIARSHALQRHNSDVASSTTSSSFVTALEEEEEEEEEEEVEQDSFWRTWWTRWIELLCPRAGPAEQESNKEPVSSREKATDKIAQHGVVFVLWKYF